MLEKGWKVISMQPFSQIVSVGSGSNIATKEAGYFGMTFVLEKKNSFFEKYKLHTEYLQ